MANWVKIVLTRQGRRVIVPLGVTTGNLGDILKRAVDQTVSDQATIIGFVDLDNREDVCGAVCPKKQKD